MAHLSKEVVLLDPDAWIRTRDGVRLLVLPVESGGQDDDGKASGLGAESDELELRRFPPPAEKDLLQLEDCGQQLWAGGLYLCDFILHHRDKSFFCGPVLELGAGLGLAGVILLRYTRAFPIYLTDFNVEVLEQCEMNLDHQLSQAWAAEQQSEEGKNGPGMREDRVRVRRLDWTDDGALESRRVKKSGSRFDLREEEISELLQLEQLTILAGDCIYDDELTLHFVKTLRTFLGSGHGRRRSCFLSIDVRFNSDEFGRVSAHAYEFFQSVLPEFGLRSRVIHATDPDLQLPEIPHRLPYLRHPHLQILEIFLSDEQQHLTGGDDDVEE